MRFYMGLIGIIVFAMMVLGVVYIGYEIAHGCCFK